MVHCTKTNDASAVVPLFFLTAVRSMTKSLTKVWLGGMKRMLSPAAKRSARDAQRITRDALEAAASAAVSDLSPPRESRV